MDRDLSDVFVFARDQIEEILERLGFRVVREVFDHAAFGSAVVEYRHRDHWLRLTWDGKDQYIWLSGAVARDQHTHPGQAAWHPLDGPPVGSTVVRWRKPGPDLDQRIAEFGEQIEVFAREKG